MLLRRYEDETVRRVAAGAIANLAMNGNFFSSSSFQNVRDYKILLLSLVMLLLISGFVHFD